MGTDVYIKQAIARSARFAQESQASPLSFYETHSPTPAMVVPIPSRGGLTESHFAAVEDLRPGDPLKLNDRCAYNQSISGMPHYPPKPHASAVKGPRCQLANTSPRDMYVQHRTGVKRQPTAEDLRLQERERWHRAEANAQILADLEMEPWVMEAAEGNPAAAPAADPPGNGNAQP